MNPCVLRIETYKMDTKSWMMILFLRQKRLCTTNFIVFINYFAANLCLSPLNSTSLSCPASVHTFQTCPTVSEAASQRRHDVSPRTPWIVLPVQLWRNIRYHLLSLRFSGGTECRVPCRCTVTVVPNSNNSNRNTSIICLTENGLVDECLQRFGQCICTVKWFQIKIRNRKTSTASCQKRKRNAVSVTSTPLTDARLKSSNDILCHALLIFHQE